MGVTSLLLAAALALNQPTPAMLSAMCASRAVGGPGPGAGLAAACAYGAPRQKPTWPAFMALATAMEDAERRSSPTCPDIWTDGNTLAYLRRGKVDPAWPPAEARRVARRARHYRMQGQRLLRVMPLSHHRVVPAPEERNQLIRRVHEETGHFGVRRTTALLRASHWWYGLKRDVEAIVTGCEACDVVAGRGTPVAGALNPLPVNGLFYRWGVDLCGPFTKTAMGHKFVMVCVEYFSKYAVFVPLGSKGAKHTAFTFLHHVLGRFGAPAEVCTDQGSEWKGEFAQLLLDTLTDHRMTSAAHPEANGLTERAVQTCQRALSRMMRTNSGKKADWDVLLPYAMLGYNSSEQASTRFSPFQLVHAVPPTIPAAIRHTFAEPLDFDDPDVAEASVVARAHAVRRHLAIAGDNL